MYDNSENGSLRKSIVSNTSTCTTAIPIIIFLISAPLFALYCRRNNKKNQKNIRISTLKKTLT